MLQKVEKEVEKTYANVPENIRQKERELAVENRRLANFVEFIAEGRGNQTIGKALQTSEGRVQTLETEINGLRRSYDKVFQAPPQVWVEEKLSNIQQLLAQKTGQSAIALRKLLGPIAFEPTCPDIGKPYYVVNAKLNALAITAPLTDLVCAYKGVDSYLWWTQTQLIRTLGSLPISITIIAPKEKIMYQQIGNVCLHLQEFGHNHYRLVHIYM